MYQPGSAKVVPPAVRAAGGAWNGASKAWLSERERAPGEAVAEWLREKAAFGLGIAKDYVELGVELAKQRADVMWAAQNLLDTGGALAEEALLAKEAAERAIAADEEKKQSLQCLLDSDVEEASFSPDPARRRLCLQRAAQCREALAALCREPPPAAPSITAVERDALALLKLRKAMAAMEEQLLITLASEGEGGAATGAAGPEEAADKAAADGRRQFALDRLAEVRQIQCHSGKLMPGDLLAPIAEEDNLHEAATELFGSAGNVAPGLAKSLQADPPVDSPDGPPSKEGQSDRQDQGPAADSLPAPCGTFAKGDEIKVWSNSRSEWLDGVVTDAFETECDAEGYHIPAGTLKVRSAAGLKWVRPNNVAATVRPR